MALDPQLVATLTEIAYYAAATSVSTSGDPVYGSPTAFLCRSEIDNEYHGPMFFPRHGEAEEDQTMLFTQIAVPVDAMIWLPGMDQSDQKQGRRCKRREICRDPFGVVSHYEIYI